MKKLLFILFIVISQTSWAQKEFAYNYQEIDFKVLHFGFTVGFNTMDFGITPSMKVNGTDTLIPELNNLSPGFHVGVVSSLRLSDQFDFRFLPGITLGQRNVLFYNKIDGLNVFDKEMSIESTFIDLPFLIKYKADRIKNHRPYLIGGVNIRNDMARNKEFNEDEQIYIKLKPFDIYYEVGFGLDFYMTFFKLSAELKYSVGTRDVVSSDASQDYPEYANSIDSFKSRLLMFSLHFE
ncbi:MAG: porin family protein [Bacteroidales bacterium]|nr:porin family protein [Bacteroidales bacterium]